MNRIFKKLNPFIFFGNKKTLSTRYRLLRRNIVVLMFLVSFTPLISMTVLNYHQYQTSLKSEIVNPMQLLLAKTVFAFELFLDERLSVIRYTAASNTYDDISREEMLNRLFQVLKKEIGGIVDLGVINSNGIQVAYAGAYNLVGRDYSNQEWFHEVSLRGYYISDVFMGYRKFPHIAIAVQQFTSEGHSWILRATIDTKKFESIIKSVRLEPESDAFFINRAGIMQIQSQYYGQVLENCKLQVPLGIQGAEVMEVVDGLGRNVVVALNSFNHHEFILVVVKPTSVVLKSWFKLKNQMIIVFIGGTALIIIMVISITNYLIKKIKDADEKRELAFRELENTQKLSSLGRLAAGVAHEINNPMAIIDQKAGLMDDLIKLQADFEGKVRFQELTKSILQSVKRCKDVTHRLLGFARRIEVAYENLDLNDTLKEVIGFLEKEALYRKIEIILKFADNLPIISSDKGQLQQVFLNILTNAFDAVEDEGRIIISTWDHDKDKVAVTISDNGCGMSEEIMTHIFEPFFTTKKGYGTGLGLPITYGIIKKLGGELIAKSEEGVGATFTIHIRKNSPET
ncbi:two-component sensor histidine kinase [bacterium]|nr:two-component sensor histidine kinase [bacterium]